MPAGSSDVASSCLADDVGDTTLGMDKGTDLESHQLDLELGLPLVNEWLWAISFNLSLSFLTCKIGILIVLIYPISIHMR